MHKRITSIVISFHLLFMTLLLFNPHQAAVKKTKHVQVRTVRPVAPVVAPVQRVAPAPTPKPLPPPKKIAKPATAHKPAPPPPAIKKPATINKPAIAQKAKPVKRTPPKKPEPPAQIWNEIDQVLAKIEQKRYAAPKQSEDLPTQVVLTQEWEDELPQLTRFLQSALHLPEVGEVKIEIVVRKDGQIMKVVVLQSESQKNRLYLQEHLPLLQLPMQFDQDKKWIIAFCNEI